MSLLNIGEDCINQIISYADAKSVFKLTATCHELFAVRGNLRFMVGKQARLNDINEAVTGAPFFNLHLHFLDVGVDVLKQTRILNASYIAPEVFPSLANLRVLKGVSISNFEMLMPLKHLKILDCVIRCSDGDNGPRILDTVPKHIKNNLESFTVNMCATGTRKYTWDGTAYLKMKKFSITLNKYSEHELKLGKSLELLEIKNYTPKIIKYAGGNLKTLRYVSSGHSMSNTSSLCDLNYEFVGILPDDCLPNISSSATPAKSVLIENFYNRYYINREFTCARKVTIKDSSFNIDSSSTYHPVMKELNLINSKINALSNYKSVVMFTSRKSYSETFPPIASLDLDYYPVSCGAGNTILALDLTSYISVSYTANRNELVRRIDDLWAGALIILKTASLPSITDLTLRINNIDFFTPREYKMFKGLKNLTIITRDTTVARTILALIKPKELSSICLECPKTDDFSDLKDRAYSSFVHK